MSNEYWVLSDVSPPCEAYKGEMKRGSVGFITSKLQIRKGEHP